MLFSALSALLIGLAIGVPVAMTLGIAATVALIGTDVPLTLIAHRFYAGSTASRSWRSRSSSSPER